MEKFQTMADFGGIGAINLLSAVITAVPQFFSVTLFVLWLFGSGSSYYIILKTTGKKRFWHSLTSMSFVCFILSLTVVAMNTATITFLDGYWVGFYILMVLTSFFLLSHYK